MKHDPSMCVSAYGYVRLDKSDVTIPIGRIVGNPKKSVGVTLVPAMPGTSSPVVVRGAALAEAGSDLKRGDRVTADTEGRAVPIGDGNDEASVGYAMTDTVKGGIATINLCLTEDFE